MNNIKPPYLLVALLIFLFAACEEKTDTEQNSDLLIGCWTNPQYSDSVVTFRKSNNLLADNYGIVFHADGSLVERKKSGWCATPPISYSDFEGSWERTDSLINILVGYWGGLARYQWIISAIDEDNLIVYKINEGYNYVSGILRNLTGLDGCGWVIELTDESRLEPINLDAYDLELAENKEIIFKYHQRGDLASICMVGLVIEIDDIVDVAKRTCNQKVIISPEEYENAPDDSLSITEMKITGNCLNIKFSASGCGGNSWIVKLIDSGDIYESYPAQRRLRLSLDNNELCAAITGKEVSFNVEDLQISGNDKVMLHISGNEILYRY